VTTYFAVSFFGLFFAYMFEVIAYFQNQSGSFLGMDGVDNPYVSIYDESGNIIAEGDLGSMTDRLVAIGFNTMSTRNAGFATIDLNALSDSTINTYSILMFIGSGPGSTAGGIRTTTLFLLVVSVFYYIRGRKDVVAFKRRIPKETITKSFVLFFTSIVLVMFSAITIQALESGKLSQET
jgi:Trk-type K+ transport system membrane component